MERHLTRADVEQVTRRTHPAATGEKMEILGVSLLTPITEEFPPVYCVEYRHTYSGGSSYESRDMFIEREYGGQWHPWHLIRHPLPVGCATPEEEDHIIAAERAEKLARKEAALKAVQG